MFLLNKKQSTDESMKGKRAPEPFRTDPSIAQFYFVLVLLEQLAFIKFENGKGKKTHTK